MLCCHAERLNNFSLNHTSLLKCHWKCSISIPILLWLISVVSLHSTQFFKEVEITQVQSAKERLDLDNLQCIFESCFSGRRLVYTVWKSGTILDTEGTFKETEQWCEWGGFTNVQKQQVYHANTAVQMAVAGYLVFISLTAEGKRLFMWRVCSGLDGP